MRLTDRTVTCTHQGHDLRLETKMTGLAGVAAGALAANPLAMLGTVLGVGLESRLYIDGELIETKTINGAESLLPGKSIEVRGTIGPKRGAKRRRPSKVVARVIFKLPRYKYEFLVDGAQVHQEDGDLLAM